MDQVETMRAMYDRISNGDIDGFAECLADDFVEHEELPGLEPTKAGVQAFFHMLRSAFPDMRMSVEDLVVSGDKAVARARMTGTHEGEFVGVPATGRHVDVQLIDIMQFADDGLVHEHWGVADMLSMMQQLGAVPAGPPA